MDLSGYIVTNPGARCADTPGKRGFRSPRWTPPCLPHCQTAVVDAPLVLPAPCLVVLVGASGAGKSTWASAHFDADQIVSSDRLRAVVGSGEDDLTASADAFELLEAIVARRLARSLVTVVDTLGLDAARRRRWVAAARSVGVTPIAVAFDVSTAVCRTRNRARAKPVPERVLAQQRRAFVEQQPVLADEGFDQVLAPATVRTAPPHIARAVAAAEPASARASGLRFGLQVPVFTWPGGPAEMGARLAAIAQAAEAAGFDSLWLMDHMRQIPLFGPPWLDMLDSWTALGYVAAATSRLRLGTMVTPVTFRNVGHLAKIVATLDVLSGGRAVCGLGLGWLADEHRAYGWPFPSVSERYSLLEDTLRALPVLWGPGAPPFDGAVLHLPETLCYPRPLRGRVPIVVGGGGERRTLALAARYADACNIVGEAPVIRRKVEVLARHCAAVGRPRDEVEVTQLSTTLVGRDAAEVAGLVERTRPRRTAAERWAQRANAGIVDDQVARFAELAGAGVGTAVVSFPDLGDTGPVERFAGVIAAFS